MEKTFNQTIEGYWRDINKSGLPSYSGVYFVYRCAYNTEKKTVTIYQLLYIGECGNINNRVCDHEKYDQWKKYLKQGEELCFSSTQVDQNYRERVEAAYIYKHQPPANTDGKNSFNYDKTRVISTGKTAKLSIDFTIN